MTEVQRSSSNGTSGLASALRWNAAGIGGREVIRAATSLLLAAILGQENYGIIGLAGLYVTFVVMFVQFGFGTALVQKEHLEPGHVGAATWLSLISGTIVAALTVVFAPDVASLFDTPELAPVLRWLSILVLLKAIAIVPASLLMREMQFAPLARAELAGAVIGCGTGITVAIIQGSYWAIVWQLIIMDGVTVALILSVQRIRVWRTTRAQVRDLAGFGSKLLGTNIVNFFSGNGDNLIVARHLGTVALANYTLSFRLLSLPLQVVGSAVARAILPTMARSQNDRAAVARIYYRSQRAIAALVAGPLVISALALPDAIPWLLGPEWSSAVRTAQWIALAGILRLVFGNSGSTMVAMGKPGWQFSWSLVTTLVSLSGFFVGVRWGTEGVAASIVITGLPMGLIGVWVVGRLIPVTPWKAALRLAPVTAATAVLLPVWWVIAQPTEDLAVFGRLVTRCTVVSLAYLGMILAMSDTRADALLLARRAPRGPRAAGEAGEALEAASPKRRWLGRAR